MTVIDFLGLGVVSYMSSFVLATSSSITQTQLQRLFDYKHS